MPTIKDLRVALTEFNSQFPRPNMDLLTLSSEYNILKNFSSPYPNAEFPGVYAIFDSSGELLRIGKVSCNSCLGARLSAYFKWHDVEWKGVAKHEDYETATIIYTIKVPSDRAFEAPALEEFLIGKINPHLNEKGRTK